MKNVHTSCILQHTRTQRENFQTFGRTHDRSFDSCGGSTPLHPQKPFHICCMKSLQNSGNKQIGNFTRQYRCDIIPWLVRKFIFFQKLSFIAKMHCLVGFIYISHTMSRIKRSYSQKVRQRRVTLWKLGGKIPCGASD